MTKFLQCLTLIGLFSLTTGCTMRMVDYTALSVKNIDIEGARGQRVQGEDMKWSFFLVSAGRPSLKSAIDQALEKGNGDLLVDGVVYKKSWSLLLFGRTGYIVEGTVFDSKKE